MLKGLVKLTLLVAGIFLLFYVVLHPLLLPVSHLKKEFPKETAMMKHRREEWERQGKNFVLKYHPVSLTKVSPYLVKAVLIAEDDKFYKHEGFDWAALQKALEKNLREGRLKYGGSTISQQLAKNLFLSPSKNPVRKIKEALLTIRLEKSLTKRRILELYLNIAEWGPGVFGAEAASRYYFGKNASLLSPHEAVRLAAVLPNPLRYNPLSNHPYVQRRAQILLNLLKRRGILKEELKELKDSLPTEEFLREPEKQVPSEAQEDKRLEEKPQALEEGPAVTQGEKSKEAP